jgi:hypothetical protein
VYFRSQARAAHRQSEVADRVALMESNLQMYSRFRETRNQFLQFPTLQREWRETQPGFSEIFDASGGLDQFIAVLEAMDGMQDVYFLRKDGVVTDQYWHVWTNTFFRVLRQDADLPSRLRLRRRGRAAAPGLRELLPCGDCRRNPARAASDRVASRPGT